MTRSLTCINQEQNLRLEILAGLDVLGFLVELEGFSDESKLIREQAKEQTMLLLSRAQRGRLSWGRDVKRVKLISDHLVFEFRVEVVSVDSSYPVRLFFVEKPEVPGITIIGVHLKNPNLSLEAQRKEQNHAITSCFQTYLEASSDNL